MIEALRSGFPKLKYTTAGVNVVLAGNSLIVGYGTTANSNAIGPQLKAMSTLNNLVTPLMRGVSGQTTRQMNGLDGGTGLAALQSSWVEGKVNVMIVWEYTNSIFNTGNNRTGVQAAQDMADFIAARLAEHPWRIVVMTGLPRFQITPPAGTTIDSLNAEMNIANQLMRDNFRAWGAVALCEMRGTGTLFDLPNYAFSTFDALQYNGVSPWTSTTYDAAGNHIHLSDTGYTIPSIALNNTLARLPA